MEEFILIVILNAVTIEVNCTGKVVMSGGITENICEKREDFSHLLILSITLKEGHENNSTKSQTEPVVMVQNLLWAEAKGSHPSHSHCNYNLYIL